jgi:hypothetical protein
VGIRVWARIDRESPLDFVFASAPQSCGNRVKGSPIHRVLKIQQNSTIRTDGGAPLILQVSLPGLRADRFPAKQRMLQSAARRRISSGPVKSRAADLRSF